MKDQMKLLQIMVVLVCSFILQSCIHEYPYITGSQGPEPGVDPSLYEINIELNCELNWESLLQHIDFATRDGRNKSHRFIIQIGDKDNEIVVREELFLSEQEFSSGQLHHTILRLLKNRNYEIAVWYDHMDDEGKYSFDLDDAGNVVLTNFTTTDSGIIQCGYARDYIELAGNIEKEKSIQIVLQLEIPGARFEIITTDIQEFIKRQKEALNQGDNYRTNIIIGDGGYNGLNLFTGDPFNNGESFELSGRMRLPFADYEELKIAEGFMFCRPEDNVTMQIGVINSSIVTVSRTPYFSFPVRRGYITFVKGEFLTRSVDGLFAVDNIWEGEIILEI